MFDQVTKRCHFAGINCGVVKPLPVKMFGVDEAHLAVGYKEKHLTDAVVIKVTWDSLCSNMSY